MKTTDFDFCVPLELIAHEPAVERDGSRLMILNRGAQSLEHKKFYDIVDYLHEGDLLVLNDTKVIPANLVGKKEDGGGKVEVLLVRPKTKDQRLETWLCLVKPGKRLKVGSRVVFGEGDLIGTCLEKLDGGEQIISFEAKGDFWQAVHKLGEIPLPPYIQNKQPDAKTRYQTVYAEKEGASAAPTAGLHFTPELLEKIRAKGVKLSYLTLHTGLGTFQPVRVDDIEDHPMHTEYFEIPGETAEAVRGASRVIAVGTTSVRALESLTHPLTPSLPAGRQGLRKRGEVKQDTKLFIYPGYKFKVVDAMITNFHWPKTTLIMLVSAFAGKDYIMKAYQEAIEQKYRFFSFGDAMFIS
ncbi:MAG: tRNA preQ1(34) S-adenosylmethionine ribosyltransferase-isomerase QueA [bacterium]